MPSLTSFPVRGLAGYVVRQSGNDWLVTVTGVVGFVWNDATQRHDIPDVREDFGVERRSTAKGAVAAAHQHARFVANWAANGFKH